MSSSRTTDSPEALKSSITAISVAMGFARSVLTGHDYIFSRDEAQLSNHLCAVGSQSLRGMTWLLGEGLKLLPYAWQQSFFNYAVVPSYDQILLLRKLMIKQKIDQALASGIKQIVFLGGGYDVRGLTTALAHPDVRVYEIDRGPTRECKLAGLQTIPPGIGYDDVKLLKVSQKLSVANDNMHYINADLSVEELSNVLNQVGYQLQEGALFIAEGLSMYLDEAANRRLLGAIGDLLQPKSECIISYGTKPTYSPVSKAAQTSSKELYQFHLPVEHVIEFTRQFGLDVSQKFSAADVLQLIGDTNSTYYIDHPDKAREYYFSLKKRVIEPTKNINDVPSIQLVIPEKPDNRVQVSP